MEFFAAWTDLALWLHSRFGRSERGAGLIEYALLVALIAMVCIIAITLLGSSTSHRFSSVGSALQ
jgi:pilus assembly protein Flp/PilA